MIAVIWDVDGTLISTARLYPEAYRRALAPYIGRHLTDEEIFGSQSHSELGFLRALAGEHYDSCLRDFQQHYQDLHDSHFGGVFPDIPETLAELRKRGIRMGVVTGKSRSSCELSLTIAKLGPFEVMVVDDDVREPKPHPEGIIVALKAMDVSPAHAIYVGESPHDIVAAHAAGVRAAAALWSKSEPQKATFAARIVNAGEAVMLHRPADLLAIL